MDVGCQTRRRAQGRDDDEVCSVNNRVIENMLWAISRVQDGVGSSGRLAVMISSYPGTSLTQWFRVMAAIGNV